MNVAVVVYEGVEVLDFAGPAEVFWAACAEDGKPFFNVYTVAETRAPITSLGFLTVTPNYGVADAPAPDIIVIPGGPIQAVLKRRPMLAWLRTATGNARVVLSVCTGVFALVGLGLLDGLEATTWHGAMDRLRAAVTNTRVHADRRWVDNGKIVTTAGVSAGIDGALHVVSRLLGPEAARRTARYMEYDKWEPDAGLMLA